MSHPRARRERPASLDHDAIARPPRPSRDHPLSSPPTVSSFHVPAPSHSATHAGGILPSASFFRPSRPAHSRPSSPASPSLSHPPDSFSLSRLRPHPSPDSDLRRISHSPSLRRLIKPSREPLLPLATNPAPSFSPPPRPSDYPPKSNTHPCFRITRIWHNPSLGSTHDVILSTTRHSAHRSHSFHDSSQLSPPLPRQSMVHPLVQITSNRPSSSPSPNNIFIPDPPNTSPPLSAVPVIPRKRVYQIYPSRNRFFCSGRLLTGGDSPWAFIASFALVIAISAAWFSTTCVWWWHNQSPAVAAVGAYMCLLTVSCMLATAFRDPGILPRDLDPDPPVPATSPSDGGVRVPYPRDLKVRTDTVRVKYCQTCKTYRPPRSSHCRLCDNCVDNCDHHCQWVNNCVGRRNYTFFCCFLLSAVLTLCLVICTSAIHLYLLTQIDHIDFRDALNRGAGSAVAFSLSILVVWPVTALLAYHTRLLLLNITTIEQIRNQAHKTLIPGTPPPNPFTYGSWRSNLAEVLCRPAGVSWLNVHAVVTEDRRRVNPGLDEAGWDHDDLGQHGVNTAASRSIGLHRGDEHLCLRLKMVFGGHGIPLVRSSSQLLKSRGDARGTTRLSSVSTTEC
ncbi:DHHC palmitoyltransferase-domain-containing protein [Boletus reticuloceps]|uniref:Palmitoyltransferase n=1 Tax=Boletus reticuloceps TaxID=495285 RepID=A0A8I2YQW3_9AGAM|nr:DHHC palmitoyltransferase-domain-containing protein [Boletus reticuloceps]